MALVGSAASAMIAAALMALTAVFSAFSAGRLLRIVALLTGDTGVRALDWAHTISGAIARVLLVSGIVVGLAIALFFSIYAWRILQGTGRARWIALAAVLVGSGTALTVEPILGALFMLASIISVVLAFLPSSQAWFVHRRGLSSPPPATVTSS
jgi:hypothetical protein